MTTLNIGLLANPDQAAVSALLSEAFAADPAYEFFLQGCTPGRQNMYRARMIRFIVGYHCRAGMPVWGVTEGDSLLACALVEVPMPGWRRALALLWQLPSLIGQIPWASFQRINHYARASRQDLPQAIQYYLLKIGVTQDQRGRGLGKALLAAMVEHYCRGGHAFGLDTENPANVPLYQHLGFRLHDQIMLDSLRVYRMYHVGEYRHYDEN